MARLEQLLDTSEAQVLEFLHHHPSVVSVDYVKRQPASSSDLARWRKENAPLTLPVDLIHLYERSNGLLVKWKARHFGRQVSLGCLHINPVEALTRVPMDDFVGLSDKDVPPVAFELDTANTAGVVALVYTSGAGSEPEVWFQDLTCTWNFLSSSFAGYRRLLFHHIGLPSWQYAYTEHGMDPLTREWAFLFIPERAAIDDARLSTSGPRSGRSHVGGVSLRALPIRSGAHVRCGTNGLGGRVAASTFTGGAMRKPPEEESDAGGAACGRDPASGPEEAPVTWEDVPDLEAIDRAAAASRAVPSREGSVETRRSHAPSGARDERTSRTRPTSAAPASHRRNQAGHAYGGRVRDGSRAARAATRGPPGSTPRSDSSARSRPPSAPPRRHVS